MFVFVYIYTQLSNDLRLPSRVEIAVSFLAKSPSPPLNLSPRTSCPFLLLLLFLRLLQRQSSASMYVLSLSLPLPSSFLSLIFTMAWWFFIYTLFRYLFQMLLKAFLNLTDIKSICMCYLLRSSFCAVGNSSHDAFVSYVPYHRRVRLASQRKAGSWCSWTSLTWILYSRYSPNALSLISFSSFPCLFSPSKLKGKALKFLDYEHTIAKIDKHI